MQPTENYLTFQLAERLGKTVRALLTGQDGPLMNMEHYLWARYQLATARLEQQRKRKH